MIKFGIGNTEVTLNKKKRVEEEIEIGPEPKIKTIQQIVDEYQQRQANPQYEAIDVIHWDGILRCYMGVSNIHEEFDNATGRWLVFNYRDSNQIRIAKIKGDINSIKRYIEIVE